MFFSLRKYNRTRGHEVTLVKDQCRLDIKKYLFVQRTINRLCNCRFTTDYVTASSMPGLLNTAIKHFVICSDQAITDTKSSGPPTISSLETIWIVHLLFYFCVAYLPSFLPSVKENLILYLTISNHYMLFQCC